MIPVSLSVIALAGLGAYWGSRQGLFPLLGRIVPLTLAVLVTTLTVYAGFRARWFHGLGLWTPILLALLASSLTWLGTRAVFARLASRKDEGGRRAKVTAAFLGALTGVYVAAGLWLVADVASGIHLSLTTSAHAERSGSTGKLLRYLGRTAHQGFVRHLPLLGPVSEETTALIFILNASPDAREVLARTPAFRPLRHLPSLKRIYEDESLLLRLESISNGRIVPLFTLLKHPKLVALFEEEAVQSVLRDIRPTDLAELLREIEAALGPDATSAPTRRPNGERR